MANPVLYGGELMGKQKAGDAPRVVVVGGGAGGLELATRLGRKLGRKGALQVTLVDSGRTHIWKPLLHEVAAGTLDTHDDEIEYLAQASENHFRFVLGSMSGLDRERKEIRISPLFSSKGELIVPERTLGYDYLVMAVGSVCNDFGVPGASTHCMFLDSTKEAEDFQEKLLGAYLSAQASGGRSRESLMSSSLVGEPPVLSCRLSCIMPLDFSTPMGWIMSGRLISKSTSSNRRLSCLECCRLAFPQRHWPSSRSLASMSVWASRWSR